MVVDITIYYPSNSLTILLTTLPSARPFCFDITCFITLPIFTLSPHAAMASCTIAEFHLLSIASGKHFCNTAISSLT